MRFFIELRTCFFYLSITVLLGCGGARGVDEADPLALLTSGRYAEARQAAMKKGVVDAKGRAIIAISLVLENPTDSSGKEAVKALTEGVNEIGTAISAVDTLELAFEVPQPVDYEASFLMAEAALGSVGQGPFAVSNGLTIPVGAASRNLGVAILERVYNALIPTDVDIQPERLLQIWNGCFTLGGGSTEADDQVQAWKLLRSIGGLAIMMYKAAPDHDLTDVLLAASVNIIENNPDIAIPAKCDLSSPFDGLKSALAHKRELSARLERSVAAALGCTRGTYAPEME